MGMVRWICTGYTADDISWSGYRHMVRTPSQYLWQLDVISFVWQRSSDHIDCTGCPHDVRVDRVAVMSFDSFKFLLRSFFDLVENYSNPAIVLSKPVM